MSNNKTKIRIINGHPFKDFSPISYSEETMLERSRDFLRWISERRSIRHFSDREVPQEVINNIIGAASSAPSGANKQPWTFCVVRDSQLKTRIREEAEKEEYESYHGRMSAEWIEDLAPLQTDWVKPFLETAPCLIIVFKKAYDLQPDGSKRNNYYVSESVGIACGFLLAAIHHAGLVALTHTPSPMNFLSKLLNRPENERPFLLVPVGYPATEVFVPDIKRKDLSQVAAFY